MRRTALGLLFLLWISLASGCRTATEGERATTPPPSPTSHAGEATEVAMLPTSTAAATELPATGTPSPTVTVTPAATPTPEPPEASPTPAATPTPEPPEASPTLSATPVLAEMDTDTWSETSPDGQWIADGVVAFPEQSEEGPFLYYTRLAVSSADGATQWALVDAWQPLGLGYTLPRPFRWSGDEPFFYFTNEPVPDGCGIFVNGSDLWRVDLRDGSVTELLPSSGLWLSLAPDESRVAYRGYRERELVVRDLDSGDEQEIGLGVGGAAVGHIVWSPDGASLMVTLAHNPCQAGEWAEATSLLRVDLESLAVTTLLEADGRLFVSESWPAPGWVLLRDNGDNPWWLDIATGSVVSADEVRKPAEAETPAAGICTASPAELVVATINPDVPDPRCSQVTGEQRLRLVNHTTETVSVQLGLFDVELAPDAALTLDAPIATFLAPGVHTIAGSPFGGGQLWLRDE